MLVLKTPCSRCARVEETAITPEKAQEAMNINAPPAVQVTTAEGEKFTLNRLCTPCQSIVGKLLTQAFTPLDHRKSSLRKPKDGAAPKVTKAARPTQAKAQA